MSELTRELQQMRLIVDRLRRDLNLTQRQLHKLEGWGDDFIKTHQISEGDTRFFDRRFTDCPEVESSGSATVPAGSADDASEAELLSAEGPTASGVRRRFG